MRRLRLDAQGDTVVADIGVTAAGLDTSDAPATSVVLPARPGALLVNGSGR